MYNYIITRNELASLAHSYYTCLKHQLMHQLYSVSFSSTLDDVGSKVLYIYGLIYFT